MGQGVGQVESARLACKKKSRLRVDPFLIQDKTMGLKPKPFIEPKKERFKIFKVRPKFNRD